MHPKSRLGQDEIQSFLWSTRAFGTLIQHVPGTVLQYIRVWMCSIHVSLLAGLHGISQQQMDTKESEIKISTTECTVHHNCSGSSVLRDGKAQILKILQAAPSEQPVSLSCSVLDGFRFCSDIHTDRPSLSELVGCLPCVWSTVMWPRFVHYYPDSDSSSMCQNHP